MGFERRPKEMDGVVVAGAICVSIMLLMMVAGLSKTDDSSAKGPRRTRNPVTQRKTRTMAPKRKAPITTPQAPVDFLDPEDLSIGQWYAMGKRVSLMPRFKVTSPEELVESLGQVRELEPETPFRIVGRQRKGNHWWYQVELPDDRRGWINSVALYGVGLLREVEAPQSNG